MSARHKRERLIERLEAMDSLLIAFSGGVDSTFLLALAHQVLKDRVLAVTAVSPVHPLRERMEAIAFVRERKIGHILVETEEMRMAQFLANRPDRCYWCKKALFQKLLIIAEEKGLKQVVHGANFDDLDDYRPGSRAAEESGIAAPLLEVCMTKEDIRHLSREMSLPTWDKPPSACLASRIPYGEPVTDQKLVMIERAEECLLDLGFKQCRVRHHGAVARLELEGKEAQRVFEVELRKRIIEGFREIGFIHIAVDLEGYVSGSMNRCLPKNSKR